MAITEEQKNIQLQCNRQISVKIEILDTAENDDAVLYTLENKSIEGSYNLDASSAIRRTCNLSFVLEDNYIPSPTSPFWINRRFRLSIGIKNINTNNVVWFNKGVFLIQNPNIDISIQDNKISINGVDKMALFNGDITGALFNNYVIEPYQKVTEEITSSTTGEFYKLGTDGNYVAVELPTDYEENVQYYNRVKVTEAMEAVVSDVRYKENIENKLKIDPDNKFDSLYLPYKIEVNIGSTKWNIIEELTNLYYNTQSYYDEDGYFCFNEKPMYDTQNYEIAWDFREDQFIDSISLQTDYSNVKNVVRVYGKVPESGEQPVYTIEVDDVNYPECLYNIQSLHEGFTRDLVIQEDSYETLEQCQKRCESEAWLHQNASDTLTFECIPIYSLNVNDVIYFDNYYHDNSNNKIVGRFIVDSIQCGLSYDSKMNVTAHRLDNDYIED